MNNTFIEENEYYSKRFSPELYLTRTSLAIRIIEKRRISKIVKLISPSGSEKILDIGCGAGDILIEIIKKIREHASFLIKKRRMSLYGIDASKFMVKRAKERLPETVKIKQSLAEELPFEDGFFDKVLCSEVLEHVENIEKVVSEMGRVLKTNGTFVISYPNENLINLIKKLMNFFRLTKLFFPYEYQPENDMTDYWHKRKITINLLLKVFKNTKLKIQKVSFLPWIFPLKYIVYGYK